MFEVDSGSLENRVAISVFSKCLDSVRIDNEKFSDMGDETILFWVDNSSIEELSSGNHLQESTYIGYNFESIVFSNFMGTSDTDFGYNE